MDFETNDTVALFFNVIALFALLIFILFFIHISLKVVPLWTSSDNGNEENLDLLEPEKVLNASNIEHNTKTVNCGPPSPAPEFVEDRVLGDPNKFVVSFAGDVVNFQLDPVVLGSQPSCVSAMNMNSEWIKSE